MPETSIDALAERYAAGLAELDPVSATEIGLPGYADKLPDYSPDGAAALDELQGRTLTQLHGLTAANAQDEVTRSAMIERLTVDRELYATGVVELNNIASPVQDIRSTFDLMPTDTAEDWGNIAARLTQVETALAGYQDRLEAAVKLGLPPAQRQVDACIRQSQAAAQGFFPELVATAEGLDQARHTELEQAAAQAAQAYADFAQYLASELYPAARAEDAVGKEYYALASRRFLGAEIDLAETYQWGLAELARIVEQQHRVADLIHPGATIEEARQRLSADPDRKLHGTEALRRWMQNLSDTTIEAMKQHFHIPAPMDYVEAMIAPTQDGGIYYTGPSEDFSRPGRMWWSVPKGEETFTTWQQTTTVFHEGVPGHHLQIATAMLNADELNSWRRHWLWVSGHGEGWALYAEELMRELGYLDDPGDYLGMLDAQRMRAARVVFDIGVHCGFTAPDAWGAQIWDPATGFAFLQEHLHESPGVLEFEFTRYLGWPGQAPSYAVGQRIWQQIRAQHEAVPGFDLRTFHTRALQLGSMGLDTLEEALR